MRIQTAFAMALCFVGFPVRILLTIVAIMLALTTPAVGAECQLVGKDLCLRSAISACECPVLPAAGKPTCGQTLNCFGILGVGEYPNCHCPTCEMDHPCTFPETPGGVWPECFCRRPEPVERGGKLDPCQAACPVGRDRAPGRIADVSLPVLVIHLHARLVRT